MAGFRLKKENFLLSTVPFVSYAKDLWICKNGGTTTPNIAWLNKDVGNVRLLSLGITVNPANITFGDRDWTPDAVELWMMIERANGYSCISSFWDIFLANQLDYGCRPSEGAVSGMIVLRRTKGEELTLLQFPELPSWPDFRLSRRFFLTWSGAIGLGTDSLKERYVAVILAGGPVSYLDRKSAWEQGVESWQFIGMVSASTRYVSIPLTVHSDLKGFMNGEAAHHALNWEHILMH